MVEQATGIGGAAPRKLLLPFCRGDAYGFCRQHTGQFGYFYMSGLHGRAGTARVFRQALPTLYDQQLVEAAGVDPVVHTGINVGDDDGIRAIGIGQ